jgi:hypothetical protein
MISGAALQVQLAEGNICKLPYSPKKGKEAIKSIQNQFTFTSAFPFPGCTEDAEAEYAAHCGGTIPRGDPSNWLL